MRQKIRRGELSACVKIICAVFSCIYILSQIIKPVKLFYISCKNVLYANKTPQAFQEPSFRRISKNKKIFRPIFITHTETFKKILPNIKFSIEYWEKCGKIYSGLVIIQALLKGLKYMEKERRVGTVSRGIRCPIIREGDDLAKIVSDSVLEAAECEGFEIKDRDVISITESIVARAQGNYASVDDIAEDVKNKFGEGTLGVIFPILSRNRFAICLRGIAKGVKKIVLMLSYPSDEVGNELVSLDKLDEAGVNPYSDVLSLARYRELFGENKHEFTGVDYVEYYGNLIKEMGAEVEIIFANQAKAILDYTKNVLNCDIHEKYSCNHKSSRRRYFRYENNSHSFNV